MQLYSAPNVLHERRFDGFDDPRIGELVCHGGPFGYAPRPVAVDGSRFQRQSVTTGRHESGRLVHENRGDRQDIHRSSTHEEAAPLVGGATLVYLLAIELVVLILVIDRVQLQNFVPTLLNAPDAANYWGAWQGGLYHGSRLVYGAGVYLYSPAFAEVLSPFTLLPWPVFRLLWLAATVATYVWLLKPASTRDRLLLIPIAAMLSATAGIEWLLCLVLVWGRRFPALWAIPLLTKITPGVGIVWFAARREWRALAIVVGVTLAVAAVSVAFASSLWFDWVDLLYRNLTIHHYEGVVGFLPVRVAFAAVIVWVGARRNRPEALILAMILTAPDLNFTAPGLFCALPRLLQSVRVEAT